MSTKIYTGFYLDVPITRVLPVLKDIKAQMEPQTKARARDAMCSRLAALCVNVLNGEKKTPRLPNACSKAVAEHLEHLLDRKDFLSWAASYVEVCAEASENPAFPSDYIADCCIFGEAVLFPYENRTFGIASGPFAFTGAFLAMPQVHDFCYWNSCDKLPDVSGTDWEARGNIWHDLIPSFYAKDDGLTYTLFTAQRFSFEAPETKDVDAWLVKNRSNLISQRAGFLLHRKLSETTPQGELSDTNYFLKLNELAAKEIRSKPNLASWALFKASAEVPATYGGIVKIIS